MTKTDLAKNIKNPKWRINNLYFIVNKNGRKQKFVLNACQRTLNNDKHPRKVIPKARQRGVTTYKCIKGLDNVLFRSHYNGDIIADTMPNAKRIFKKIKFAFENLPEELRDKYIIHEYSSTSLVASLRNKPEEKSSFTVSVTTRGATSQDLHISELGRIGDKFPDREEEIRSGALESVGKEQEITAESTAMGKRGLFWNLTQQGIVNEGKTKLSPLDWKLFFFPWWEEPDYTDDTPIEIPEHLIVYFEGLEKMDIKLSLHQKYWYTRKEQTQGWTMRREYPSFVLEAFEGQTEGLVYINELGQLIKDGRYKSYKYDPSMPVYTFWDLGWSDSMTILFVQGSAMECRIFDYYENNRQKYAHYVKVLQDKPYVYANHYIPHDGKKHSLVNGKTVQENLQQLGLKNVKILERLGIEISLQEVRKIFMYFWINKNPAYGATVFYDRINNYRYEWNEKMNCYSKDPVHDINSHGADPLRALAQVFNKLTNRPFIEDQNITTPNRFGGVQPIYPELGL